MRTSAKLMDASLRSAQDRSKLLLSRSQVRQYSSGKEIRLTACQIATLRCPHWNTDTHSWSRSSYQRCRRTTSASTAPSMPLRAFPRPLRVIYQALWRTPALVCTLIKQS